MCIIGTPRVVSVGVFSFRPLSALRSQFPSFSLNNEPTLLYQSLLGGIMILKEVGREE